MKAKFVKENMQMPFHNDGNIPIIQKYPLENPNIIGDCAYDNKKKKKRRKVRKTNESVNEGIMQHVILGLAGVYCLYRLIKGLKNRNYNKMSSEEKLAHLKWRLSVHYYNILIKYVNNYLNEGNKVEFIDTYTHYIFKLGSVTIKINKSEKTIVWSHLSLKNNKWVPASYQDIRDGELGDYEFIEPIPISQEEIDGLVEAIKEDNNIKD